MSAETDLAALLAEHAVRSTATDDVAVCTCGRRFHSDTAEYTQLDEDRGIVRHAAHVAGVVSASFAVTPLPKVSINGDCWKAGTAIIRRDATDEVIDWLEEQAVGVLAIARHTQNGAPK